MILLRWLGKYSWFEVTLKRLQEIETLTSWLLIWPNGSAIKMERRGISPCDAGSLKGNLITENWLIKHVMLRWWNVFCSWVCLYFKKPVELGLCLLFNKSNCGARSKLNVCGCFCCTWKVKTLKSNTNLISCICACSYIVCSCAWEISSYKAWFFLSQILDHSFDLLNCTVYCCNHVKNKIQCCILS